MATTVGREEKEVFAAYLAKNRLKRSEQREAILDAFLRSESHLSVDDLLQLVQKRRPDIGRTTVYRTLKLLQAAGLAQELALAGRARFEREYKRGHHDHFICQSCGDIFEFSSPEIERHPGRDRGRDRLRDRGPPPPDLRPLPPLRPAPAARSRARARAPGDGGP